MRENTRTKSKLRYLAHALGVMSTMSDLDSAKYWHKELIESLRLIASEYDVQKESLPDFIHLPDEILNAIVIESFPNMLEHKLISEEQFQELMKLHAFLDEMKLPDEYDELLESLRSGKQFQNLRIRASKILNSLGFELTNPAIGAVYVKGS